MLSHSGGVSVSVKLLTFEGKYTFSGYLLHVLMFWYKSALGMFCLGTGCTEGVLDNGGHHGVGCVVTKQRLSFTGFLAILSVT